LADNIDTPFLSRQNFSMNYTLFGNCFYTLVYQRDIIETLFFRGR